MLRVFYGAIISGGMCEEWGGGTVQPACLLLQQSTDFWRIIAHPNSNQKSHKGSRKFLLMGNLVFGNPRKNMSFVTMC